MYWIVEAGGRATALHQKTTKQEAWDILKSRGSSARMTLEMEPPPNFFSDPHVDEDEERERRMRPPVPWTTI